MKPINPFMENEFAKFFDVSKLTGEFSKDFKMPGMDMTGLLDTQRRNLEALTVANQRAYQGLQAVMQRQTEILRQAMEEGSDMVGQLMHTGTPEEKMAKQTELVRLAFERTVTNMRELAEMIAKSNYEAADVLTQRVSDSLSELKGHVINGKKG